MKTYFIKINDRFLKATFSKKGLVSLDWPTSSTPTWTKLENQEGKNGQLVTKLLENFFAKNFKKVDNIKNQITYDLQGTEFQKQVWQVIKDIPTGKVLSYKQVAKKIHNPHAVRAVGGACGKNPVPLIIPCHRVVASNGKLGGFSGKMGKKRLLKREGVSL